jgi:hypothetical protein
MGPEAAVRGAVRAAGAATTVSGTARLAAVLERAAVAIFGAERARR